jgi:hypothetical protein
MASWGTPVTHFTGDTLAVSDWNTIANNETFLYQAPYCNYYDNGGTNIPSSTYTMVALGGVTCAGYGFSVSSNFVVVPLAGIYWVAGAVAASSNQATGWVAAYIYHNESLYANGAQSAFSAGDNAQSSVSTVVKCAASDTLNLGARQTGPGPMTTNPAANLTYLAATFAGSV